MKKDNRTQQEKADYDVWFRRQVQAGIDSANAGLLIPNEEVAAKFAKRRAETLRKIRESEGETTPTAP